MPEKSKEEAQEDKPRVILTLRLGGDRRRRRRAKKEPRREAVKQGGRHA